MQEVAQASIVLLDAESGGRKNGVIGQGCRYRPHVRVGTEGEYLGVCFVDGPETIALGVEADVVLVLVYHPGVDYSALAVGVRFEILEGPHVVGSGLVTGRGRRAV